jgi:hypothetical protein
MICNDTNYILIVSVIILAFVVGIFYGLFIDIILNLGSKKE